MSTEAQLVQPVRVDEELVHHLKLKLPDLLPARMLNEFVYCPRLFYYEWVEGTFENSADTLDGQAKHTRVNSGPSPMPGAEEMDGERIHSRSVTLSSERVGLTAKLDLIESDAHGVDGKSVRPVDYKRGKPREVDGVLSPWPSDRVQIAAQALVLRDNGYTCDEGILYYVSTKQRVRIAIDDALIAETEALIGQARAAAVSDLIPEPLVDSPKCPRCSLGRRGKPEEIASAVVFLASEESSFVTGVDPLGQITEEHFDRTFDLNVRGTLFTVQKALPLFNDGKR